MMLSIRSTTCFKGGVFDSCEWQLIQQNNMKTVLIAAQKQGVREHVLSCRQVCTLARLYHWRTHLGHRSLWPNSRVNIALLRNTRPAGLFKWNYRNGRGSLRGFEKRDIDKWYVVGLYRFFQLLGRQFESRYFPR